MPTKLQSIQWPRVMIGLILAAIFGWFGILLWVPSVLVVCFFIAVDIFKFDRSPSDQPETLDDAPIELGVISRKNVDGTPSYGLFLQVLEGHVFVDIREDDLIAQREQRANFLFLHAADLEDSLKRFLLAHPAFQDRSVTCIGLHAKDVTVGEVFWHPSGYTTLKGLEFVE